MDINNPHIVVDDDELTMEWWNKKRNVTVTFNEEGIEILKVWGVNIHNEMETVTSLPEALKWLMEDKQ